MIDTTMIVVPLVAAKADLRDAQVKARSAGRSHNPGFSNRMLDTTVALMNAK